jgi:hypothetical protein
LYIVATDLHDGIKGDGPRVIVKKRRKVIVCHRGVEKNTRLFFDDFDGVLAFVGVGEKNEIED